MNYLLNDLMEFEKTADRKIRYDHNGKTMFLELIGSSDTDANIKNHLDGAKRSGIKAKVVPWDTPYDKPKADQEKVAMPVFNEEATRSRNFLPGVPEALEKVKEAEATKNKVLKPYNEAQPAINVLKQRFEKNQARLSRAESQEWARDRLRSSGRSLNRLAKNRPVPIGPMSEAMEKDWDPTGVRKNIKHWGQEYKKSLEKNPNDIKYKNHYEKQMDLSERLLERAKRNAPSTKDVMSATNERSDAGRQYRLARGAYNTKREQNLPAVPTPPKDIFLEGWKLSLKKDMRDLGRKTREDIEQMHQETLNDFAKSRAERKQKMMEDIDRGAQKTLDNLAKSRADQKQETEQAVKTPFSRNKALGLGVGLAGTAAALGGGAYLYNRYKKKKREQEQEKVAAPMFGKDRYRPVDNFTKGQTFYRELQLMDDDQENGSNYDPEYYKKIKGEEERAAKTFMRDASGKMVSAVSLVAASHNAKKGIKAALSGDKDAANRYKKLTGIASIYPTYRLAKNLKNRYHWSKQENIDQDNAFRKKDQEITDRWNKRFYPNGDPDDDDFDYNKSNTDDPELLELIKMEKRKKTH